MKQMNRLGLVALSISFAALSVMSPVKALATSQMGLACPQKIIATVTNVEDVQAGAFPKIKIDFQVIQTLKGNEITSKKIQIIKGGPVEFISGEIYTVEYRDNWLCSATRFSKI